MANTAVQSRVEELTVSRFCVDLGGLVVGSFKECSGLSGEIEVMTYQEGGLNDYEHKLPGRVKYGNVKLGTGIASAMPLWEWFQNTSVGNIVRKEISIVMYSQKYEEKMRWNLVGAYPVRWEGPSFTAGEANVAVHSLEIAHHGIQLSMA